ncbi:MAG: hypothetical protein M0R32_12165 [Candidatus Cloacimonetes bacterium]|jgi:hypothetical protein|nr:hypothetical protein [Candidatus Cloacimonadota bacterium]
MSSKAYSAGTSAECPHCGKILGPINSYVVQGYIGSTSIKESLCPECNYPFYVEHIGNGEYWLDSELYDDEDFEDEDSGGKKW